jgi:galactokinase
MTGDVVKRDVVKRDVVKGEPGTRPARATFPTRACLSGEDLDWLGGRAVCLALDLTTTVEAGPDVTGPGDPGVDQLAGQVWAFLRARLPGAGPMPPRTAVRSQAPVASGLSSSTALIVGLFRACIDSLESGREPSAARVPARTLAQWAYEFEFEICHGGGMDQLSVILGGALLAGGVLTGLPEIRDRLAFPADWTVVVVDSATPKSTSDHIRTVRAQSAARDPRLADYLATADQASGVAWQAIRTRDLPSLHAAMRQAHGAMRDLQRMSTPLLEQLRRLALDAAGLRLKLSGAGGGGALVGVCPQADAGPVVHRLRQAYAAAHPGVRVLQTRAAPLREPAWPQ